MEHTMLCAGIFEQYKRSDGSLASRQKDGSLKKYNKLFPKQSITLHTKEILFSSAEMPWHCIFVIWKKPRKNELHPTVVFGSTIFGDKENNVRRNKIALAQSVQIGAETRSQKNNFFVDNRKIQLIARQPENMATCPPRNKWPLHLSIIKDVATPIHQSKWQISFSNALTVPRQQHHPTPQDSNHENNNVHCQKNSSQQDKEKETQFSIPFEMIVEQDSEDEDDSLWPEQTPGGSEKSWCSTYKETQSPAVPFAPKAAFLATLLEEDTEESNKEMRRMRVTTLLQTIAHMASPTMKNGKHQI
jgi:hypothetical protein